MPWIKKEGISLICLHPDLPKLSTTLRYFGVGSIYRCDGCSESFMLKLFVSKRAATDTEYCVGWINADKKQVGYVGGLLPGEKYDNLHENYIHRIK